jgi:transposase InsO family protein
MAVFSEGMPWKFISLVQTRVRFVRAALKAQEPFARICARFHISRKTGYKWRSRFLRLGPSGMGNQSKCPKRSPQRTAAVWLRRIRKLRRGKSRWGARKLRAHLRSQYPRQKIPAVRTITRWLHRWKLTRRRPVRSVPGPLVPRAPLTQPRRCNQVWTVDFKGWFRTANGQRVEPLTVRDLFSRYILSVQLLPDQQWWRVRAVFLRLFARYGQPTVIRADNGFGSKGAAGLSRLSAWWTTLGIRVEFIQPGHPEQNGGHEHMHREFKADLIRRVSRHARAQQRRIARWVRHYNQVRPHEALGQRTPAQVYRPRRGRFYPRVPVWQYPVGWERRRVRSNGQIRWLGRLRFMGEAFVGLQVGLQPAGLGKTIVYLRRVLLGALHAADPGGMRPAKSLRAPNHKNKKL